LRSNLIIPGLFYNTSYRRMIYFSSFNRLWAWFGNRLVVITNLYTFVSTFLLVLKELLKLARYITALLAYMRELQLVSVK
jgi:hypothetical protein